MESLINKEDRVQIILGLRNRYICNVFHDKWDEKNMELVSDLVEQFEVAAKNWQAAARRVYYAFKDDPLLNDKDPSDLKISFFPNFRYAVSWKMIEQL